MSMTENEIIKMLEVEKAYMDSHGGRSQSEALAYAIESVKEIQQYREIGTVEELIKTQIREKVLNVELESYKEIGTIEEFRQAMRFKEYFMELYGEGLEVANWHKNGDLEPLVNFIDEACS